MKCIPLNTNKYMSFSIPIKKEVKEQSEQSEQQEIKEQNEQCEQQEPNEQNEQSKQKKPKKKVITYNLKFIDSARHQNRALSTLVDNLSELNKCKCEETKDKNMKLKIEIVNNKKTVITKCKTCKSHESQLVRDLIKKFPSTYKLCNKSTPKFIVLLKKAVYPHEYMDSIDRFNETTLPNIEKFYSKIQQKHISKDDYNHAKKVLDMFEIKTLGDYHDLYVQADTAQLSDVFQSFRS